MLRTSLFALTLATAALAQTPPDVTVRNERVEVTIAPAAKGAIIAIRDRLSGRDLAAAKPCRLFGLDFTERADATHKRFTLSSTDAEACQAEALPHGARLTYTRVGGRDVTVVCTVTAPPGDQWLRWRIETTFAPDLLLELVRYPVATLRAPLADGLDDAWVSGATKGGIFWRPSAWDRGRSPTFSQPGSLTAQFSCYYDPRGGVVTAAFDAVGHPKGVTLTRTADGVELGWYQGCLASGRFATDHDRAWTTFGPAAGETAADWRDAADLYKAWAVQQRWCAKTLAQRTDLPDWLKQGPAMVRFHRNSLGDAALVQRWLDGYWKRHFPATAPLITAYWGWEKVETWVTPDYFPPYPDDATFAAVVKACRAANGHPFPWPSGYHYTVTFDKQADGTFRWDDRARFDATCRAHAVVGRDGKVIISDRSWLRGGQTACLCPGDPFTIDWFNRIGDELAKRGVDMVQVDQVVGGNFPVCYSDQHGHPPGPGPWMTEVFGQQLDTLRETMRRHDPQSVVCFEEPNEWFIHQVGVQDYRDWEVFRRGDTAPASVFNYVYHEYLPTFQSNPQVGNRWQTAWCLVTGQIPHLVPSTVTGPGPALNNGEFEAWTGQVPTGWEKLTGYQGKVWSGECFRDETIRHGGASSLRLVCDQPGETTQVSQNVYVGRGLQTGRTYRIRGWLRGEELQPGVAIGLSLFAPGLKGLWSGRLPFPTGDWTAAEATFTVPADAEMLRIMIHVTGPGTGWVDDLTIEELPADGPPKPAMRPETPSDHALMLRWVQLFHGDGRPYLLHGKMLHPPRLEVATEDVQGRAMPAILHNAFEAPDGSRAVVLANPTRTAQTGRLTWQGQTTEVRLQPDEVRLIR